MLRILNSLKRYRIWSVIAIALAMAILAMPCAAQADGALGIQGLLKNSQPQIPHRLKPVRDDKYEGLMTAYLKVRPFKCSRGQIFQQPVQARVQASALNGQSVSWAATGMPLGDVKLSSSGETDYGIPQSARMPGTLPQAVSMAVGKNLLHIAAIADTGISARGIHEGGSALVSEIMLTASCARLALSWGVEFNRAMPAWLALVAFVVVYVVVTQWILPKLGVPT